MRMTGIRNLLLVTAAGLAFGATPAFAQTDATAPAEDAAAEEAATEDGGEIIVTAQRRAENLQDVPIQVSVANSEYLARNNIDNGLRLTVLTPSLALRATDSPSSGVRLLIRGVGVVGPSQTTEGGVGVFVDGIYRSRNGSVISNFLDYDSVQVLKGPQGTLFGKNTTAGALVLTSTKPDLNDVEGRYEVRVGNYREKLARGSLNIPLVDDKLAMRVSLMGLRKGGFVENLVTGGRENQDDSWAGKVALRFEPTDDVRFNLIGDWAESDGNCCGAVVYTFKGSAATGVIFGPLSASYGVRDVTNDYINNRDFTVAATSRLASFTRDRGVGLNGEFDVGPGTLTSITGFRQYKTVLGRASSFFSPADILSQTVRFDTEQFSQEFLYDTEIGDRINALFGAFYSDEDIVRERDLMNGPQAAGLFAAFRIPGVATPGLFQSERMDANARSMSVFTHWSAEVTDQLTLAAGIRYSDEKKKASYDNLVDPPVGSVWTAANAFPGPAYSSKFDTTAVSGTGIVSYKFSPDATVFAKFSRGFKAGGVVIDANAAGTPANNPDLGAGRVPLNPNYRNEFINSYELGGKFRFLNGRGSANMSVFYNDITDLQVPQFLGVAFSIISAKSAKNYGFELESNFEITDAVSLSANATWIPHAKYGKDLAIEGTASGRAVSGQRFLLTPKLAASAAINLDQPVTDTLNVTGSVSAQYSTKQRTNSGALPIANANGYVANQQREMALIDASIGLKNVDEVWDISAYCNNCTNIHYVQSEFGAVFQTGSFMGFAAMPRTYGVTLRGKF